MAAAITAREFKLLLKPELFPTKQAVIEFNDVCQALQRRRRRIRAASIGRLRDALGAILRYARERTFGPTASSCGLRRDRIERLAR